jgi:hypothetical protein
MPRLNAVELLRHRRPTLATSKSRSFRPSTTFRFIAYHDLKRTLGQINAVVETAELAMRSFTSQARLAPSTDVFVRQMSKTHGVKVDTLDLPASTRQMNHFYIVSVHQHFESFLKGFKKEYPQNTWLDSDDNSLLKNVLSSFAPRNYNEMIESIGRLELDIVDYYRNVRNAVAHGDNKNSVQSTLKLRSRVQDPTTVYTRLSAPNPFAQTDFDDFILFTRAVKHVALALCSVARPTDRQIAGMILLGDPAGRPGIDLEALEKKKRNPGTFRSALGTLLRIRYGLDRREAQPIIELLLSGSQALR